MKGIVSDGRYRRQFETPWLRMSKSALISLPPRLARFRHEPCRKTFEILLSCGGRCGRDARAPGGNSWAPAKELTSSVTTRISHVNPTAGTEISAVRDRYKVYSGRRWRSAAPVVHA